MFQRDSVSPGGRSSGYYRSRGCSLFILRLAFLTWRLDFLLHNGKTIVKCLIRKLSSYLNDLYIFPVDVRYFRAILNNGGKCMKF